MLGVFSAFEKAPVALLQQFYATVHISWFLGNPMLAAASCEVLKKKKKKIRSFEHLGAYGVLH